MTQQTQNHRQLLSGVRFFLPLYIIICSPVQKQNQNYPKKHQDHDQKYDPRWQRVIHLFWLTNFSNCNFELSN